jgi:hypothetical protein
MVKLNIIIMENFRNSTRIDFLNQIKICILNAKFLLDVREIDKD